VAAAVGARDITSALSGAPLPLKTCTRQSELLAFAYPYLKVGTPIPEWRLASVRKAASRFAVRVLEPRSRPLKWRAKPGLGEQW
jgi:hypothetical protein